MNNFTPMIQQYLDIKSRHPNSILFFRLGDFYEMFFDDAKKASDLLQITLTARDGGGNTKIPMCGVPYHAADNYISRLLAAGQTVAICEQTEDPAIAKGLVRREVVRTITPGTQNDADPAIANYIVALVKTGERTGFAAVEYSTGNIVIYPENMSSEAIGHEIQRLNVREAIVPANLGPGVIDRSLSSTGALRHLSQELDMATAIEYCRQLPVAMVPLNLTCVALGEIVAYLRNIGIGGLSHFTEPRFWGESGVMALDAVTRRNLELTKTLRSGAREGSLLWVLDQTITPMGARLIRQWIEQPLVNVVEIDKRLTAVEELSIGLQRIGVRNELRQVQDIERMMARIAGESATPRDLRSLANSLQHVAEVKAALSAASSSALVDIRARLNHHPDLTHKLLMAIDDAPPAHTREGGYIRDGFSAEIDELRLLRRNGKSFLAELETRERAATGIKSLKIGFNRVFGYYLEVGKSYSGDIPLHYHRKQTLANAERFVTEELKHHESMLLTAEDRLIALEQSEFDGLCREVAAYAQDIVDVARSVAVLDVLQSFAEVAVRNRYYRPQVVDSGTLVIIGGRHPVVERIVGAHAFVPNDTDMARGELAVITGPNMAGKSTYMRQVALITLMAQMGSFVPATQAVIGVTDRVFTRVGAADDLYGGQSTFMVEMTETALALRESTARSLLLFDEVGRGTSTYDGMAIARAIMEFVHDTIGSRTLFSTHYHELTSLADRLERCRNYTVSVLEQKGEITFLRRVAAGKSSKSYGIHVAELAGLPKQLTNKAYAILRELEQNRRMTKIQSNLFDYVAEQTSSTPYAEDVDLAVEILRDLETLQPAAMTPLQALNFLFAQKERIAAKAGSELKSR